MGLRGYGGWDFSTSGRVPFNSSTLLKNMREKVSIEQATGRRGDHFLGQSWRPMFIMKF